MSTPSFSKQPQNPPEIAVSNDTDLTNKQRSQDDKTDKAVPLQTAPRPEIAEDGTGRLPQPCGQSLVGNEGSSTAAFAQPSPLAPVAGNPAETEEEDDEDEEGDEDPPYEEAASEQLLPPPDFRPFFTLIEDPETSEHYHPNVHYCFSDDDPVLLTTAALDAITTGQAADAGEQLDQEERIVVLDMAGDGREVVSATSLSPHWQALRATITQAPSWGRDATTANTGLMIKISGQEAQSVWRFRDKVSSSADPEELAQAFNEKLQRLDDIMGNEGRETTVQEQAPEKSGNV